MELNGRKNAVSEIRGKLKELSVEFNITRGERPPSELREI